jgi:hypothetical protein
LKTTQEKPKPAKRTSIFGSVLNKLSSPTSEKKETDVFPPVPAKEVEPVPEASKSVDEAVIAAPTIIDPVSTSTAPKADDKPISTPTKEKDHFSFGRFFSGGSKDRAKSPAATDKAPVHDEPTKVDAVAPQIEETPAHAPIASEPTEPIVAAPVVESKAEPTVASDKKEETTPKKEKRGSIFSTLSRSLSKATKQTPKEKKEAPTTVPESTEEHKSVAPVEETPAPVVPTEKSIGDVFPEAVTVGEAPKSNSTVTSSA